MGMQVRRLDLSTANQCSIQLRMSCSKWFRADLDTKATETWGTHTFLLVIHSFSLRSCFFFSIFLDNPCCSLFLLGYSLLFLVLLSIFYTNVSSVHRFHHHQHRFFTGVSSEYCVGESVLQSTQLRPCSAVQQRISSCSSSSLFS